MRRVAVRFGVVLAFILLIAYSGFATYRWMEADGKNKSMMSYAVSLAGVPLWELAEAGSMFEYLIRHNATDKLLNERISTYSLHARTLSYSSAMLHALTKDEKYQIFRTAMKNLEGFFITVKNRPNGKEVLESNLDVLKWIGEVLKEKRISDLTFKEAEKILELSGELKT